MFVKEMLYLYISCKTPACNKKGTAAKFNHLSIEPVGATIRRQRADIIRPYVRRTWIFQKRAVAFFCNSPHRKKLTWKQELHRRQ